MTGDCHVRFCERLGAKLPRPTDHNSWVAYHRSEFGPLVLDNGQTVYHHSGADMSLILEVAFLIFVFATIRYAWKGLPRDQ
jgi:hypothetical protein